MKKINQKRANFMKQAILLTIVLIIPSIAYLLLTRGENHYKPLPIFTGKQLFDDALRSSQHQNLVLDTISHRACLPYSVVQEAIYVIGFLLQDSSLNRQVIESMLRVHQRHEKNTVVQYLSFGSCASDSICEQIKNSLFQFIGLSPDSLFQFMKVQYGILSEDALPLVLLDKAQRIRGYYPVTNPKSIDTLIDDLKVLNFEYIRVKK